MALPAQPLNSGQRQRVCTLLALGATRRMAAEFADCRCLDLEAELKRDPAFKLQVQQHELRPEIEILQSVLRAARDPNQWRAAAWVLERLYPRRYAARKRDALTPAELRAILRRYEKQIAAAFPDPKQRRKLFQQLLR